MVAALSNKRALGDFLGNELERSRTKRERRDSNATTDAGEAFQVKRHPLRVLPSGNAYSHAEGPIIRPSGSFKLFSDELTLTLLETFEPESLVAFGATCKYVYAFSRIDDLWKTAWLEQGRSSPKKWLGCWRNTFLGIAEEHQSRVSCQGLYSDVIYRPYFCAQTPLEPYAASIPPSGGVQRLPNLTEVEFSENWADKPFILTEPVTQWPAFKNWVVDRLLRQYGETIFRAESVDWKLSAYVEYMRNNQDESPLYLFDKGFSSKMALDSDSTDKQFTPPVCFGEDLFALLGETRPDNAWLIVGPERSGSTFHKDPNATSAWNAVLSGSKYWIMFPPDVLPPGVFVSEDQSEVTSPLSIAEWLLGFHEEAVKMPSCLRAVCQAGEVLHIPSGWWHLVVNLEPAIAITQNFIPRKHLKEAILFLRNKPDQVSGFRANITNPYDLFSQRLKERYPKIYEEAMTEIENMDRSKGKSKTWEKVREPEGASAFTFGFDDDEE